MTTFGVVALLGALDLGRERRDVDGRVGERRQRGRDIGGADRRQVGLQIDDDLGAAPWVDLAERLEDPVRARGVVGTGHDGAAARFLHRRFDLA